MLPRHRVPDDLRLLAAAGPLWIEIHGYTREEFDFSDHALVVETKQTIARHGLRIWSCHSPAYEPLDLASPIAVLRAHSCAVMQQAIEASAELGAMVFVCDAVRSFRDAAMRKVRLPLYADSLHMLLGTAGQAGLRFVIENHTRTWGPFTAPEDLLNFVADYDLAGLGACWDTGHGWIAGHSPEAACRLGSYLVTLHVHENDGRRDLHQLPARGTLPWRAFVDGLLHIGYGGPFMMELTPPEPPTADAIGRLIREAAEVYRLFTR